MNSSPFNSILEKPMSTFCSLLWLRWRSALIVALEEGPLRSSLSDLAKPMAAMRTAALALLVSTSVQAEAG